ncbi:MAG: pyruvate:ferredoxin (flavodoxin) oxidoreductase [Planctomycetes bacterium]|nr:pyruvate:ferredoxin (flavodoxin) oxidoreductase [Planctomycetota bacterium]
MAARVCIDGNEAVASVAHRLSEVVAIYPITPATAMGELADAWSAEGRRTIWGTVPEVVEMQSEAGAIAAVHGALQAGALATTFTASQGLLLMIPSLYKLAGELTAFCMHVASRAVATHALSIFGDHSDVMAVRPTGVALLSSGSVQEAHDLAAIAHATTLRARVPFLHFMDGFRTSHEVATIEALSDDDLRALIDDEDVAAHRRRALDPDRPVVRGTAQDPDVFFQAREAQDPFFDAVPEHLEAVMARFAARTGRRYAPVEWTGHPEAERAVVVMGSAAGAAEEAVERLVAAGERVGLLRVRLYRPFPVRQLLAALPGSVRGVVVMDRTKEPGAPADPLHLDVALALGEAARGARVIGARYGLASKELTPSLVKAALDELAAPAPRPRVTLGIVDDLNRAPDGRPRSLAADPAFDREPDDVSRAVFFGLGADGTVGSNKETIKIIADAAGAFAQAYFVYDSKKSGSTTVSHLRFGPRPIRSTYLVREAGFVACHQAALLERREVLERAAPGATVLLNVPWAPEQVWGRLPREAQEQALEKGLSIWAVDADAVAREVGLPGRVGTILQACFFALSGVVPRDEALGRVRASIEKTFARKGPEVVRKNLAAVDLALDRLFRVPTAPAVTAGRRRREPVPVDASPFVRQVTAALLAGHGDLLPVSAFPPDGTWPAGTSRYERRGLADEVPAWDADLCIQCNKCALMCPHAAIRAKVHAGADPTPPSAAWRGPGHEGSRYALQVAPDDCTGCALCVAVCPAKDKHDPARKALAMAPLAPVLERARADWDAFLALPEVDRAAVKRDVKGSQLLLPLFEFSGACAGCGETPYLKLLTQLFGDRMLVANATGCSSIYGGNLPTTPWTTDAAGRGPAWCNSLFEDNAEFGLGLRVGVDAAARAARALLEALAPRLDPEDVAALLADDAGDEAALARRREALARLRARLAALDDPAARRLEQVAHALVPRSVWLVGGDGWAYDIDFGGLDHVLALGRKVNVLVLDTEVYSNTGGQQSKATPLGATAKFAAAGKAAPKKDLGLMAMSYGHIYVARVALGAKDAQTLRALEEAERFPGPSLVIAYCPCIAHGYDLAHGAEHQRLAVDAGAWPLYRFDPRRADRGEAPLVLDSPPPRVPLERFTALEGRFAGATDPARLAAAQADAARRYALYQQLARLDPGAAPGG